ncbi:MAG: hypothetical protein J0H99_22160 [Rhodospirillales bacterium]|nr:hypothetical protein [Rhodospirillales bacterium]
MPRVSRCPIQNETIATAGMVSPVAPGGPHGGERFRQQHQQGDDDADDGSGRADRGAAGLQRRRERLGAPHHRDQRGRQDHARDHELAGRRRRGGRDTGVLGQEILPVAHRLHEQQRAIQGE